MDNAFQHQPHINNKSIVSILCPVPDDGATANAAMTSPSLVRTLSVDMSCLADHQNTSSNDGQLSRERKSSSPDTWSSILSQNQNNNYAGVALPHPYVHPMVAKRSKSCTLSEKSLEICTESLGSETGSDGFSSYPPSEHSAGDSDTEDPPVDSQLVECCDFSATSCRRSVLLAVSQKSFPPPLPSLAARDDGSNLHMRSHRENGRLVVEAVAVPSQNCFRARRQDGRLLLTLADSQLQRRRPASPSTESENDYDDEAIEENNVDPDHQTSLENESENSNIAGEDEQQCEESNEGRRQQAEVQVPKLLPAARMATTMNVTRILGLTKTTTSWPLRFNKVVTTIEEAVADADPAPEEEVQSTLRNCRVATLITTTTPSSATAAAEATTLNAYECYWRTKPTPVAVLKPLMTQGAPPLKVALRRTTTSSNNNNSDKFIFSHSSNKFAAAGEQQQQELLLVKGKKAEYLVPLLKGCKEQKRSLLFWAPYCIATF